MKKSLKRAIYAITLSTIYSGCATDPYGKRQFNPQSLIAPPTYTISNLLATPNSEVEMTKTGLVIHNLQYLGLSKDSVDSRGPENIYFSKERFTLKELEKITNNTLSNGLITRTRLRKTHGRKCLEAISYDQNSKE
jgi:hypothetical protein